MRAAALLCTGLLLSGCAKLPQLPSAGELSKYLPSLSFRKVDLTELTWQGATADFVFDVSNPNPIEVKVASFTYALDLSEQPFLTGESDDGLQLKGKGDTKLRLPVALTFADAIGTAQATAGQDIIPFTLRGDFGFDTPLGQVKVPYEDSGELPVLRVPKIRLAAARVAELKPLKNTARLEIDLGVAHDQGSPLGFADFDYALGLNGAEIATGLVADLATVQPGKEATVTLPVDLNLLSLGASIVTAITKKEKVQLSLDAGLDVSTPLGVLPLSIDETGKLQLQ